MKNGSSNEMNRPAASGLDSGSEANAESNDSSSVAAADTAECVEYNDECDHNEEESSMNKKVSSSSSRDKSSTCSDVDYGTINERDSSSSNGTSRLPDGNANGGEMDEKVRSSSAEKASTEERSTKEDAEEKKDNSTEMETSSLDQQDESNLRLKPASSSSPPGKIETVASASQAEHETTDGMESTDSSGNLNDTCDSSAAPQHAKLATSMASAVTQIPDPSAKNMQSEIEEDSKDASDSSAASQYAKLATSVASAATEIPAAGAAAASPHSKEAASERDKATGSNYEYDERIARKKKELMEQAASTQRNTIPDRTAEGATVSCTPWDELAAAVVNQVAGDDGSGSFTAAGDELAAARMPPSPKGSSAARKQVDNDDLEAGDVDKKDSKQKNDGTVGDTFAAASQDDDELADEKRIAGSAPLAFDVEESDEVRPGAYEVPGRAFGTFPAWGRHNPQIDTAPPVAAGGAGAGMNDHGMIDLDNSQASLALSGDSSDLVQVTATVLDEDEIEDKVRQQIFDNAVQAEMVEPTNGSKIKRTYIIGCVVVAFVFIAVVVGLSVGLASKDSNENRIESMAPTTVISDSPSDTPSASPTQDPRPTLKAISEDKILRCGVRDIPGFNKKNNVTGRQEGFDIDLCHAVAAAIFGDTNISMIEPVVVSNADRFFALQNESIDVLFGRTTYTMDRDVFQGDTGTGFSFSVPYLYDGVHFAGDPSYVACANNLSAYFGNCRLLLVCVANATTHVPVVERLLPGPVIVAVDDVVDAFISDSCNVMAGEKFVLPKNLSVDSGYTGEYVVGTKIFSKEPLAVVTRDDDVEWSDFVNWIVQALLAAEEQGITQTTAENFSSSLVFGDQFKRKFIYAIAAVGNYGEIYDRHLEDLVSREDVDMINTNGSTGLLYAPPFGESQVTGPGPVEGSALANITLRGQLRCGITARPGFADYDANTKEWSGMDADYCYALSSSLFNGTVGNITFVNLPGTAVRFLALTYRVVDVLAGANANIMTDVKGNISEWGFSFSQPYYYDPPVGVAENSTLRQTRALATRQDDPQWSSFVYWIVASSFYAERNHINQTTSRKMPIVNLFGPDYASMFQNATSAVGNSKEIYRRNVESFIPRSGRNRLNKNPYGPQHYPLPFI